MTLEKLQVIIEAYTKPYRDELDKVKQQTTQATAHVEKQTSRMSKSYSKVGTAIKGLLAALSITAILAFGKSCIDLGSDLAEVQNVVDVTFGDLNRQVDAFSKNAIKQFGLSELTAKKYMGTYGAMAKSFGIVGEAGYQMSAAITGLTGDVASFYNLATDEAYTKLKSIFTGETESLKELGVVMTQTALDQYALNNGFGKTTAKMTEQEKVMLRYRFVMSSLADASGDFVRTSDGWANQVRVLQLQFESFKATIGQGLINAFAPVIRVINTILARLQTLANYFRAFTTAFFGNAGSTGDSLSNAMGGAADSSGSIADNMGNAAESAKKMKEYTLGIDELNVLNPDAGSGGSGGGESSGGGAPDFGNMGGTLFGEVEVNPDVEAAVSRLKDALEKLKNAAKPTTDAVKKLWDEGLLLLGGFSWTALKDFWDYFLAPLGKWTLGEGLPRFIDITNDFLKAVDWDKINEALRNFWMALEPFAEGIGSGLLNFYQDLSKLGAGFINIVVPGGLNGLAAALNTIDPEQAEKIGYALGIIGTSLVGLKIAGGVATGVKALGEAIRAFPGVSALTSLFSGLGGVSGFAFWAGLSTSLQNMVAGLGSPGAASFDIIVFTLLGWINDALDKLLPDWVNEFFGNLVAGIVTGAVAGSWIPGLGSVAGAIVGAILGPLNSIKIDGTGFMKNLAKQVFSLDLTRSLWMYAEESFRQAFKAESFHEFGINIIDGIINGLVGAVTGIVEPIWNLFLFIGETIKDIFGIHSPAETMKPYGEYILLGIIEGFTGTFGEWTQSMSEWYEQHIAPWFTKQKWSQLYDTIKTELKSKWDETVGAWSVGVAAWWGQKVAPWFTLTKWLNLYDSFKSSMGTKWNEASDQWKTDISVWWDTNVAPWFTLAKWSDMMGKVPEAFRQTFITAVNGAASIFNRFIDWLNEHMRFEWDDLEIAGQTIVEGGSVQLFTIPRIPTFRTGGFPEDGLFMANSGELVGRFSNGRTAVANNEQIVSGIQRGVKDANEEQNHLLREAVELLNALLEKDTVIQMDSREIGRSVELSRRRSGYRLRTT